METLSTTNATMTEPFEDISCPDFFALGDKSMILFISHAYGAQYYIGSFTDSKFTPENHGRMNWPGGSFFASEQLLDPRGRNIIWGWIIDWEANLALAQGFEGTNLERLWLEWDHELT